MLTIKHLGLCNRNGFPQRRPSQMVIVEDSERAMKPLRTPPFPAHAQTLPGAHHVPPNLPLHPAFDHRKAAARIADPKVVHPAAKDGIDRERYVNCILFGVRSCRTLSE